MKTMFGRLIAGILTIALLITLLPQTSFATTEAIEGTFGEYVTWSLDIDTGLLTIEGNGPMPEVLNSGEVPWSEYSVYIRHVVIKNGVTSIGNCAFYNRGLESISIPDTVTEIGSAAFYGCKLLKSITIPDSVTSIGSGAFGSSGLTAIDIPDSVTSIGRDAFYKCLNLESVTLSKNITAIEEATFWGDYVLASIEIPSSVKSIGNRAFQYCYSLKQVKMTKGLTSIGDSAFADCTALEEATIPSSVTEIGMGAFVRTEIKTVVIPEGVTRIGDAAFYECESLEEVTIQSNVREVGSGAFRSTKIKSVTIHEGVEIIDDRAFSYNPGLETIILPKSIKSIQFAFQNCNNLSLVHYTGTEEDWKKVEIFPRDYEGDFVYEGEDYLLKAELHYAWIENREATETVEGYKNRIVCETCGIVDNGQKIRPTGTYISFDEKTNSAIVNCVNGGMYTVAFVDFENGYFSNLYTVTRVFEPGETKVFINYDIGTGDKLLFLNDMHTMRPLCKEYEKR